MYESWTQGMCMNFVNKKQPVSRLVFSEAFTVQAGPGLTVNRNNITTCKRRRRQRVESRKQQLEDIAREKRILSLQVSRVLHAETQALKSSGSICDTKAQFASAPFCFCCISVENTRKERNTGTLQKTTKAVVSSRNNSLRTPVSKQWNSPCCLSEIRLNEHLNFWKNQRKCQTSIWHGRLWKGFTSSCKRLAEKIRKDDGKGVHFLSEAWLFEPSFGSHFTQTKILRFVAGT